VDGEVAEHRGRERADARVVALAERLEHRSEVREGRRDRGCARQIEEQHERHVLRRWRDERIGWAGGRLRELDDAGGLGEALRVRQ
jgi:hypothetical protein